MCGGQALVVAYRRVCVDVIAELVKLGAGDGSDYSGSIRISRW